MVRGKVHLKKIENPVNRRVTFSKRKRGMLKKAEELSVLCEAEVGLMIFSPTGRLFEFASPRMNRTIEKYQKYLSSTGGNIELSDHVEALHLELENLQKGMTQSEKTYKHMIGEDLELLNFKELQCLEKKIKLSVRKIHSRKEKMLLEHIRSLKVKEKSLTVENANLVNKEKSLTVENANLAKRIEKSRTQHFNIDIMEGVTNDLETQQDPPQTDLNLVLS
ncbi:hypothetical protein SUGI_0206480 [Cryptomeria japonica]|nr:hypothetical protein SUGI_0206480 [Cryptomeria japonica]